jgi:hypothetical protein
MAANQPRLPVRHRRLGAEAGRLFGRVEFDLVRAVCGLNETAPR